jgi:hypothetical protein
MPTIYIVEDKDGGTLGVYRSKSEATGGQRLWGRDGWRWDVRWFVWFLVIAWLSGCGDDGESYCIDECVALSGAPEDSCARACAGRPWDVYGRVVGYDTKSGISGVEVSCLDTAGMKTSTAITDDGGYFSLKSEVECDELFVEGNGIYRSIGVSNCTFCESGDPVIELQPK